MQVVSFPSRQPRKHYRHELRSLTYVTLDAANGGIIRNLNSEGVAVQAVAPLRPQQRVRVRFELRLPRLRVETYGLVSWSSSSGQCGIRFTDLPFRTGRQIDEWIFSNLLDTMAQQAANPDSIFTIPSRSTAATTSVPAETVGDQGLASWTRPRPSIAPVTSPVASDVIADRPNEFYRNRRATWADAEREVQLNWLARPISARTLAGLIDSLIVFAGLLLFTFIFLSIAHELPRWPLNLGAAVSTVVFVALAYWGLFFVFGGLTLGARLAEAAASPEVEQERDDEVRLR